MEKDAEEKMEETKEDIDEAVHNPVSPCSSSRPVSYAAESLLWAAESLRHAPGISVMPCVSSSSLPLPSSS